jgi:predicted nucleic acid-binding protein
VNGLVLDASAAIEIACETELGKKLFDLLDRFSPWWVPDHFHVEAAAGLRNLYVRKSLASDAADAALHRILEMPLFIEKSLPSIPHAWRQKDNLTVQDSLYVLLASKLGFPLLTSDMRLSRSPNVGVVFLEVGDR